MSIIIKTIRSFDSDITFNSGQCFRWLKKDNIWQGIVKDKFAKITGEYQDIHIECIDEDYIFWQNYFDNLYDYNSASDTLLEDMRLKNIVNAYRGIILLRQPFFETLISFIISANNNVPRIKSIIDKLTKKYGKKITMGYCFPEPSDLAKLKEEDLKEIGCGYRSKYIIETSKIIAAGYDYRKLIDMPLSDARDELCKLMGVGKKVADCVLIFSLGRKDAYPVDTWVRKASVDLFGEGLTDDEIRKKANERFGNNAALAQQYMFIAQREKKTVD